MSYAITYDDEKHKYWIDGDPVPSVTQILDVLPKPALTWWGFRVGMAAAMEMCKRGKVAWPALISQDFDRIVANDPAEPVFMPNDKTGKKPRTLLEHWAILLKLHPNAVRDKAATRGTSVHEALNQLGLDIIPSLSDFPPEDRPYVQGLCRWWLDQEPRIVAQEQIVGSKVHSYAGRFDLLVRDSEERLVLMDLKTGKDVYPDSHFRQLQGYAIAWEEMGGKSLSHFQILNINAKGDYKAITAKVRPRHFLDTLNQFKSTVDFEALQKLPFGVETLKEAA